jgi:hypothetical protein
LKGCEFCKALVMKSELVLKFQALRCHHRQFLCKVLLFLTREPQALITGIKLRPVGNRSEFPTEKAGKNKQQGIDRAQGSPKFGSK